ncbi:MAG: prolyl oligopeptidase family serine peptidase [Phycisphaerae bacterium]
MPIRLLALLLTALPAAAVLPPPGNDVPPADRAELEASVAKLAAELAPLKQHPRYADVAIYHKAVDWPLRYKEPIDVKKARAALAAGLARAADLRAGKTPWLETSGPRGYVSAIDGSIQPYVVAVPRGFDPKNKDKKYRLDFFFHGRSEKLMELDMISGKGQEAPTNPPDENRFVVWPYGRYCCANKFAGEIDTFEVLADMKRQHAIDENRILATGFSMGGAAAWHHAVHYADRWAAVSPGAGFCETRTYQKMDVSGEWEALAPWQKQLMHLYDCPDVAINLTMVPTIAYAGTDDPQQQSGTIMEKALAGLGYKLERVWGPKTGHKYEPAAKKDLAARLDAYAAKGRNPLPAEVRFATYTLRYNKMFWVRLDGLDKHWEQATVNAKLGQDGSITATTSNVSRISFAFDRGQLAPGKAPAITIDGAALPSYPVDPATSYTASFVRTTGVWIRFDNPRFAPTRKFHGLQGPIDDAFLSPFILVKPTGKPLNAAVGKWADHELAHATAEWRKIFRGEPRVKSDVELTDDDIANHNVILFGDPSSNAVLGKLAEKLPIKWTADAVTVGGQTYPAASHAPILIYPNPLNRQKYVVLNSGFTFRQADHKTNSRQIAKLPDWAVIDLTTPPDEKVPGGIKAAGFFDEQWELQP